MLPLRLALVAAAVGSLLPAGAGAEVSPGWVEVSGEVGPVHVRTLPQQSFVAPKTGNGLTFGPRLGFGVGIKELFHAVFQYRLSLGWLAPCPADGSCYNHTAAPQQSVALGVRLPLTLRTSLELSAGPVFAERKFRTTGLSAAAQLNVRLTMGDGPRWTMGAEARADTFGGDTRRLVLHLVGLLTLHWQVA